MSVQTEALKNKVASKVGENTGATAKPEDKKPAAAIPFKSLLDSGAIKKRFEETLKEKAPHFITSLLTLYNGDYLLQKCDPMQVIAGAMKAAALDLPIDKNLGYMWIIPYKNGKTQRYEPNTQMGYKGYIQLALRTGQYKSINAIAVYEGEFVSYNKLTEKLELNLEGKTSDTIAGFAGYFELINGFTKSVYWTAEEMREHRAAFSKTKQGGLWETNFEAMGIKTVLRNMLSKWGVLSIQMQQAYSEEIEQEKAAGVESDIDIPLYQEAEYTEVENEQMVPEA